MAVRSGAALCGNRSVRARLVVRVGDAMAHIGHVDQDLCPAVVRERICGLAVAYAAACADGCTAIIETIDRANAGRNEARRLRARVLSARSLRYHMQFLHCLAYIFNNPLRHESMITTRELYYSLPIFQSPSACCQILQDVCGALKIARHNLFVEGSPKGLAIGDMSMEEANGIMHVFADHPELIVPGMTHRSTAVRTTAQMVIIVEKEAVFSRFVSGHLHHRMQAILITGKGVPDMLTRRLIRRLQDLFDLPTYGLFDYNPSGALIMATYKHGSCSSFDSQFYTCHLRYIGLFWSDLRRFQIGAHAIKELTVRDRSVARSLLHDPAIAASDSVRRVISDMLENGVKSDLEALNDVEFDFVIRFVQRKIFSGEYI
ncbi:DNA topoisomerase (ATP-hydrolyzing) [Plasmodiophora brassicae]